MNKLFENKTILLLGYVICFVLIYYSLFIFGIAKELPNNINLLNWDASWYHSIAFEGYHYSTEEQSNSGFFPFFSYFWKFLNASPILISILNLVSFLFGFRLLIDKSDNYLKHLWLLSLPSVIFFYVPYTEAFFFLFSASFLFNFKKGNNTLAGISILLMGLVRPIFLFVIPALIGILILNKLSKRTIYKFLLFIFIALISTIISFGIIGYEVGDFFAYSNSQINHWNHSFGLPSFPFTTWRGYRILWLDGFALFILIFLLLSFIKLLNLSRTNSKKSNEDLLIQFSGFYLLMVLFYVVFFHPEEAGRTSLLSLNRYVLTSPFLFYLIINTRSKYNDIIKKQVNWIIPLSLIATLLLIGIPYTNIIELSFGASFTFAGVLILYILIQLIPLITSHKIITFGVILFNILIQAYLYQSFLKGNWIG